MKPPMRATRQATALLVLAMLAASCVTQEADTEAGVEAAPATVAESVEAASEPAVEPGLVEAEATTTSTTAATAPPTTTSTPAPPEEPSPCEDRGAAALGGGFFEHGGFLYETTDSGCMYRPHGRPGAAGDEAPATTTVGEPDAPAPDPEQAPVPDTAPEEPAASAVVVEQAPQPAAEPMAETGQTEPEEPNTTQSSSSDWPPPSAAERAAYAVELMIGWVETDRYAFGLHCTLTRDGGVGWFTDPDYQWEACIVPDSSALVPDAQRFVDALGFNARSAVVRVVVGAGAIAAGCTGDPPPDAAGCSQPGIPFTIHMDEPRRKALAHEYAHLWGDDHDLTHRCAALWSYTTWVPADIGGFDDEGYQSILNWQTRHSEGGDYAYWQVALNDSGDFTSEIMKAAAPHCEAAGVWRLAGATWEWLLPPQNNTLEIEAAPPTLPS